MLSQRQNEILLDYCNQPGTFFTSSYFAKKLGVSLRTVQGDMQEIRREMKTESSARLVSKAAKGSCIVVQNQDEFSAFLNSLYQEYTTSSLSYPVNRTNEILLKLLTRHRAISLLEMEESLYISRSTLSNDLKKVNEILGKYHLELMRGGDSRIMVDGTEIDKRRCISGEDLYLAHVKNEHGILYVDERRLSKIKTILTDALVKYEYHISDMDFNNTILFINIILCRITEGFYIQPDEIEKKWNFEREYEVSGLVFKEISRKFLLKIPDEEIKYLAVYLRGKGNFSNQATITPEMDAFVQECLENIKEALDIDLTENTNLRITLALHCISLSIRIRYDMQIKNEMLDYIREAFPMGYDVGTYFGYLLQKKYGKALTKDEIALLAIHFYSSLTENELKKNKKRILIISSLKKSMTVVLRERLMHWFSEYISAVDIVPPMDLKSSMLDDYEIILTTEKGKYFENGIAMFVNAFPKESDYRNIKLNIDGFKDIDDVTSVFSPKLFYVADSSTKEKVLKKICDLSVSVLGLDGLYEQIIARENIGSTFFSRDIACPHPMNAVSSDTFVTVFFAKKPIKWDAENNKVNLIMLLHVGKSNPKAFQIWFYMSKIFSSKGFVDKLKDKPDYKSFISLVKEALENEISSKDE